MQIKKIIATLSVMSIMPMAAIAAPNIHYIVAPHCLTKALSNQTILAKNDKVSLIKMSDSEVDHLITIKNKSHAGCGGFMDITASWNGKPKALLKHYTQPQKQALLDENINYTIQNQELVNKLLKDINPDNMWKNLTTLSSFEDRYAKGQHGVEAANWIKNHIDELAKKYNRTDVSIRLVETGSAFKQSSVVVKIGTSNEPGVVLGAHMDTLSSEWSVKPGADDDGSGTVTNIETARMILSSGVQFKRPIYFVWYAAEEEGLYGSQAVVKDFKKNNIPVLGVLHFDMTGYAYKNDLTMWLMDDYTDKSLREFLEKLINTYVKRPVGHSSCGYACSDHASWYMANIPAAIPFEARMDQYNPTIHTSSDTIDRLNLTHMTDYAKAGVAFAVELAEPV